MEKPKVKPDLALGVKRVPGGWVVVTWEILNGKAEIKESSIPDNRGLALEKLQTAITVFWEDNE